MGIDSSNPDDVRRTRPKKDFDLILTKFLDDLLKNHVHSRSKKDDFEAYAREIRGVRGLTDKKVASETLDTPDTPNSKGKSRKKRPRRPKVMRYLPYEEEIFNSLNDLGEHKLPHLYSSITSIKLESHTPLLSIGAWAFLESLSSKAGRNTRTDFPSFFNKQRLQKYGIAAGKGDKAVNEALRRLSASGDVTKHDGTAALFNGEQLANDLLKLKQLIIECIEEAKGHA